MEGINSTLAPASPRLRAAQFVVVLFHATGFLGLAFSDDPGYYLAHTPLTLLLTLGLLAAFQPQRNLAFWGFCFSVGLLGFLAEFVGVNTGQLFGHYSYGQTLGWQYGGVPPLIGLNWVMVSYLAGMLARYVPGSALLRLLAGALLMLALDVCLEPVAGRYDFWHWTADIIPLRNFRDWFILACLTQYLFQRADFVKYNPLVPLTYLVQLLFFFGLGSLR
ncbi:carotenoid biosynthesis protein [uncultured Hymenobacter sp.]|uniref:carotenoid biosynthesis protein n=1 Tax=uncultured Hymenobacter sp. TaxID=170016 RepID=UPI0035C9608C